MERGDNVSHIAVVETQIKDLDSLEEACKKLGLELRRGQQRYRWYGHLVGSPATVAEQRKVMEKQGISRAERGECDHAIGIPGDAKAYEVGVVRSSDGSYRLVWDYFAGGYGLMGKVAADSDERKQGVGKLVQAYTNEVVRKQARKQGFSVRERVGKNGAIVLELSR